MSCAYRCGTRHPGIGPGMLLLRSTALGARPVGDLLRGFAGAVYDAGATGLAWMTSAMGFGAMFAGFIIAQRGNVTGLTALAMSTTLLMGIALIVFSFAPTFWIALVAVSFSAFGLATTGIASQSPHRESVLEGKGLLGRVDIRGPW